MILRTAKTIREAGRRRHIGVTGTVDKICRRQLDHTGFVGNRDGNQAVSLPFSLNRHTVEKQLHPGFLHFSVEYDFEPFGIEKILLHRSRPAHVGNDLLKNAPGKILRLPGNGILGKIPHQGIDIHGGRGATQGIDPLNQKGPSSVPCGGQGRSRPCPSSSDNTNVIGTNRRGCLIFQTSSSPFSIKLPATVGNIDLGVPCRKLWTTST